MVVDEIMSKNPYFIEAKRSVREAMHELLDADIRHLPVVDDGNLVGILSDRDVRGISSEALTGSNVEEQLAQAVSQIMSGDVLLVNPETELTDAIDLMIEHKVGALPVVRDNALVGIVSYIDVLKLARNEL
jgi:acetoin utilization protein AcuB